MLILNLNSKKKEVNSDTENHSSILNHSDKQDQFDVPGRFDH